MKQAHQIIYLFVLCAANYFHTHIISLVEQK